MALSGGMNVGIHLPQAGPAASGIALKRAAVLAEELGFADVWVSDHLAVPAVARYPPSAHIYEALTVLTWVGAVTRQIGLGTTVLVLPLRNPLVVAKSLASLDRMTDGRLILGVAGGWLEPEFGAVGIPFEERGMRTDEALHILRTVWTDDPITQDFPVHRASFRNMRALPQPERHIPIWVGGHAPAAMRRAVRLGDGWHGAFLTPAETASRVSYLRKHRPAPDFTISMRTRWDPLVDDTDAILREFDAYREAGVSHIVAEPRQRTLDNYLRSIEFLARLSERAGVGLDGV